MCSSLWPSGLRIVSAMYKQEIIVHLINVNINFSEIIQMYVCGKFL